MRYYFHGQAYDRIEDLFDDYCALNECETCGLNDQVSSDCFHYCEGHHAEAAKRMGATTVPKLCGLLGVRTGEWFVIRGFDKDTRFRVLEDGSYETVPANRSGSARAILMALENPDLVEPSHHLPEFSDDELAFLRVIYEKVPEAVIFRSANKILSWDVFGEGMDAERSNRLPWRILSQIEPGCTLVLDELFGGKSK